MGWAKGDRVVHAAKPEWGIGEIISAESAASTAVKDAQRLTIRFERAGTKAISTEFAELKPPGNNPLRNTSDTDEGKVFSFAPTPTELKEIMMRLPDEASDPFISLQKRFTSTLHLYRFSENSGLLLDWACMQTGLKDPLTRFNRQVEILQRRDRPKAFGELLNANGNHEVFAAQKPGEEMGAGRVSQKE